MTLDTTSPRPQAVDYFNDHRAKDNDAALTSPPDSSPAVTDTRRPAPIEGANSFVRILLLVVYHSVLLTLPVQLHVAEHRSVFSWSCRSPLIFDRLGYPYLCQMLLCVR